MFLYSNDLNTSDKLSERQQLFQSEFFAIKGALVSHKEKKRRLLYVMFMEMLSMHPLGLVQTSNFSCAESNVNELCSLFELICIRFGT